ncbi:Lrp/AsnC family transcriptional regulator [Haladaptatus halobius]|uniref:Lrp/AsnC family transcriptional regulator n=1 Tax=Haladaptatus halobius TaxID=2884875 RepID=UPI001D0B6D46|nr:Lrp/AsnC family transcriptional regulator [Haladaptatus halobius]
MVDEPLDDLDRRILHLLQVDARGITDTEMAEDSNVTGTTIATRITKLEDQGIIRGYHPDIDYEQAGYPLVVLFICTAPLADRSTICEQALGIVGVVNIRQMMAGEQNLHIEVVAESISRIEEITKQLDGLGLTIHRSNLLATETVQPWNHFHGMASENDPPATDGSED